MKLMLAFLDDLNQRDIKVFVENGELQCDAPKGALTPAIIQQLKAHKADLIALLTPPRNQEREVQQPDPRSLLSYPQQQLWFLEQLGSDAAYNSPIYVPFAGALDVDALSRSLNEIVRRHEILRTTYIMVDDIPIQTIQAGAKLELTVIDLGHLAAVEQAREVERLLAEEAKRPFDLTRDLMLRATLLSLGTKPPAMTHRQPDQPSAHPTLSTTSNAAPCAHYVLLLTFHHIAADGWSFGVLFRELHLLYEAFTHNRPSPLPELPIQYADFAHWQRQTLRGKKRETLLAFWRKALAGAPTRLALPTDRPYPPLQTFRGGKETRVLSEKLAQELKLLRVQTNTTLFMVLLAAFKILLFQYTKQDDILVGSPIANRNYPQLEALIGFFVNVVIFRTDLSGNPTFTELLTRVSKACQDAYAHQELPVELVVEAINPVRNPAYNPLFQVVFTFHNEPLPALNLPGLQISTWEDSLISTKFDLEFHLVDHFDQLQVHCIYNTDLFEQATIERLVGHYQTLLAAIVANPQQSIAELSMLTDRERQQILVDWNDTATDYSQDQCIHQLFEAQVAHTPDAVALVFDNGVTNYVIGHVTTIQPLPATLTYGELNARANQLAHYLQSLGVGAETLVGLCVERSIEMVVGILAILKAGGAYVPLDPNYPQERLAFMIEDTAVSILLTQERLLAQCPSNVTTICLDVIPETVVTASSANLEFTVSPEHLAYIMYTSGSTGRPKGVCVTHRNVVRLVQKTNFAQLTADEVFLQLASISFDASTLEIWGALLNGAKLVVLSPQQASLAELGQAIRQHHITTLWLTAGLFHLMVDERIEDLRSVRQLLAGGDVLSVPHVQKVLAHLPACRLINGYGPTENTTFTCYYPVVDATAIGTSVPIGRPIANTQVYILNDALRPVPIGVAGELYTGGDGVARGYHQRPELTAEKFIRNPFGAGHLYKTGDLARWLPDGNIEFLGRIDNQVKVRGFRIELGEIEAALTNHPEVQEAVVVAQEDVSGAGALGMRLVAYVTRHKVSSIDDDNPSSEHQLSPSVLRNYLLSKLPDYMIPSAFVLLDTLPLTLNGKVDRKALPTPVLQDYLSTAFAPPQTPTEELVAAIWMEVLGLPQIGIHDDFFAIGGHSLLATQVISRLGHSFQINLPLRALFEAATVHMLSCLIEGIIISEVEALSEDELDEITASTGELEHIYG